MPLILETLAAFPTAKRAAQEMAGNYRKWPNYAFFGTRIPRHETLMIGYVGNHEGTLQQLVNSAAVSETLKPWLGDLFEGATASVQKTDFCGDKDLLTEVAVQVYDENGGITPAFRALWLLGRKMKRNNGVVDRILWDRINRSALLRYVNGELPYLCQQHGIPYSVDLVTQVTEDLIDNEIDFDDVDSEKIEESMREMELV